MKKKSFTIAVIVLSAALVLALAMLIVKMTRRMGTELPAPPSSSQPQSSTPEPSPSVPEQPVITPETVEMILTQKELNEYISDVGLGSELARDVEIILLDGGKFELSGKVDLSAAAGGEKLPGALAILPKSMLSSLPVTAQGAAVLDAEKKLTVSITELKLSGFTVPESLSGEIAAHMEDEIATLIDELADFSLTALEISQGRLYLKGEVK